MIRILLTTLALTYSFYLGFFAGYLFRRGDRLQNTNRLSARFINYFRVSVPLMGKVCLAFSLVWTVVSVFLAIDHPIAEDLGVFCAIVTIWVFPIGTMISVAFLISLYTLRMFLMV